MRPLDQAGEQTTITYESIVFDVPIERGDIFAEESEAMIGSLLRLAWRNLWYNPGRTLIAMTAIGLGYAMLLFVACLMAGLRQQMIESGTDLVLSDIEVHAPDYYPDRPIQLTLGGRKGTEVSALLAAIAADPRVQAASPRAYAYGLVSATHQSAGVQLSASCPIRNRKSPCCKPGWSKAAI